MTTPRTALPRRRWALAVALLAGLVPATGLLSPAADHRDGPIFVNTAQSGFLDINDVYAFQAPGNINNTVLILSVQPFPGNLTPATINPNVAFELKVDNNQDAQEDITFRFTYGPPNANGVQQVTVRALPSAKFPPVGILASGQTGTNIPIAGGGMFRAAVQDDPFFFDAEAFRLFVAAGAGSPARPVGQAKNFFGPNVNTFAMVLELPTARLRSTASNPNIGVWARSEMNGVQQDRMGRPAINTALIPPVPRNNLARGERRTAFNLGLPRNDRRDFRADMISVLTSVYGRPLNGAFPTSATSLADFLLPDILTFNTSTAFSTNSTDANGFPNGRRLRDDVIDLEFSLLTGGAITTDNVPDDNGTKITDGTNGTTAAFPYIGAPNLPLNGSAPGNTAPNP